MVGRLPGRVTTAPTPNSALIGVAFTWSRSGLRGRGRGRTRREDAELAGHLQVLAHAPVFSDAAVPDAEEVMVCDRPRLPLIRPSTGHVPGTIMAPWRDLTVASAQSEDRISYVPITASDLVGRFMSASDGRARHARSGPNRPDTSEMAKQQLDILNGQDQVLAILDNFASKDMPGRQRHIQDCVDQILAKVNAEPEAG